MHQSQIQVWSVTTLFTFNLQELQIAANYCTGKRDKWNPQTTDVHLLAHSHPSFCLFTFFSFPSPLHLFTAKSHGSSHWFRAITLVATGQQSGRGLGLTRPVIRAQQKPASPYSIAPVMGCHSSAAHPPGIWLHKDKWMKQASLEIFGGEWGGRDGARQRRQLAYSVVARLEWRVSMQRGGLVRGSAQQRRWHISTVPERVTVANDQRR